jgi:hypothetical protein
MASAEAKVSASLSLGACPMPRPSPACDRLSNMPIWSHYVFCPTTGLNFFHSGDPEQNCPGLGCPAFHRRGRGFLRRAYGTREPDCTTMMVTS